MPDDFEVRRILQALCTAGRPILLREFVRNSCIASAKVARDVLHRFRIEARAVPVDVAALNAKADAFLRAGQPERARAQEDGAYGVGIDMQHQGPDPHSWDGHLVLLVNDKYLLDITADQMERVSHDILVKPLFGEAAPGFESGSRTAFLLPKGGVVIYKASPANQFFRQTPDWMRDFSWVTDEVFRAVSAELLKPKAVSP